MTIPLTRGRVDAWTDAGRPVVATVVATTFVPRALPAGWQVFA
jgi:hypothetical protein